MARNRLVNANKSSDIAGNNRAGVVNEISLIEVFCLPDDALSP